MKGCYQKSKPEGLSISTNHGRSNVFIGEMWDELGRLYISFDFTGAKNKNATRPAGATLQLG